MRAFKCFIGVVLLAVLFGCGKKAEIMGTVLDNFGKVVEGATVKIENTAFTATTDKDGKYRISYVPGKVDVNIIKQGYLEEKLNLNIATESQFPAKDVILYKIPLGTGVFAYGTNDYIALNRGQLIVRQAGFMGADSSYYVSGDVFSVFMGSSPVLIDNDGKEQSILEVGPNSLIVSPRSNTTPIKVPVAQVGSGVYLWDITSLKTGQYALVTTAVTFGGLVPTDPIYLFEVRKGVSQLIKELNDSDIALRRMAAYTLGSIGPEAKSAVGELIKALTDSDDDMRRMAAGALGRIGSEANSAVPELTKMALSDINFSVRQVAGAALGKITEAKNAVPEIATALSNSDATMRIRAAEALGQIGIEAKSAIPKLIKALSDSNVGVRQAAVNALGQIGTEAKSAIPELKKVMSDSNIHVREDAARALNKIDIEAKSAQLFKKCNKTEYGCVILKLPDKARCKGDCVNKLRARLQAVGIKDSGEATPSQNMYPKGCIGFRKDLGGTIEGANFLASFLGPSYKIEGENFQCSGPGWPYIISLE